MKLKICSHFIENLTSKLLFLWENQKQWWIQGWDFGKITCNLIGVGLMIPDSKIWKEIAIGKNQWPFTSKLKSSAEPWLEKFRLFKSKIQYDDNQFLRSRTLIVRFEDIALDELGMAEKIYNFVGLEMHPKVRHVILMNDRNSREEKSKRKRRTAMVHGPEVVLPRDLNVFGELI